MCNPLTANARAPAAVRIYISTKASTVCYMLDESKKVAKFLTIKNERRVNAFKLCLLPARISHNRASAKRSAPQSYEKIFDIEY